MRWYVYKIDGNNLGLILDHNTTAEVAWYADDLDNSQGPLTLMSQLDVDTTNWKVEADVIDVQDILNQLPWYQNLEDKSNWEELYQNYGQIATNEAMSKIDQTAYSTMLELYKAGTELLMTDYSDIALPRYLHQDLYSNCDNDMTCTTEGYWTKTASLLDSDDAIGVINVSNLYWSSVKFSSPGNGIRPVIELSK